jgi:hypothetical protein
MANRFPSQQAFHSPGVQSSARTIVGMNQNRMAPVRVSTAPRTAPRAANVAPPAPIPAVSRQQMPIRPSQGAFNGQRMAQPNMIGPSRVAGARAFSSPAAGGRSFSSAPARVWRSPSAPQGHVFSAQSTGGRGSLGGFRGGGTISGRGGSFGGGSRGGHR